MPEDEVTPTVNVRVRLGGDVRDTGGSLTLWVDDQLALSVPNLDTLPTGGTDRLQLRITYSGVEQLAPATVYTDDVVVDVTQIGCTP